MFVALSKLQGRFCEGGLLTTARHVCKMESQLVSMSAELPDKRFKYLSKQSVYGRFTVFTTCHRASPVLTPCATSQCVLRVVQKTTDHLMWI